MEYFFAISLVDYLFLFRMNALNWTENKYLLYAWEWVSERGWLNCQNGSLSSFSMSLSNRTIAFWRQTILSVCVRAHIRRSSFADATWTVYLYYFKFHSVKKAYIIWFRIYQNFTSNFHTDKLCWSNRVTFERRFCQICHKEKNEKKSSNHLKNFQHVGAL